MKNIINQLGTAAVDPLTGMPIAQAADPVQTNNAVGPTAPIARNPADPTGTIETTNPNDLNFNPSTRNAALMMYGGKEARGVKQ
jgi:hypothetical protein|tara:strand:+ start:488 stop:739 length:252 start_codon:yes stop_codon:yes gene_type:complete